MEKTCVIIKPDGVCKKLIGKIIDKFETSDIKVIGIRMTKFSVPQAEEFYSVHKGKPYFEPFINFLTSAPVIAMVLEGENVITRVRQIIGVTDSRSAAPGTLRNLYGTDNRRNLVHASDSPESVAREIKYLFDSDSIYSYEENDWDK